MLFGKKTQKTKVSQNIGSKSRMDTATISEAGKQMAVKRYGRTENALNVGNNGKKLFKHIYKCATQDGTDSTQVTKESKMKYEAYQQVYSFTGLQLDKLTEKNGTYYTDDGKNVLDITDEAIDNSGNVPKDFKQQMKDWIRELVSGVSLRGWNNIPDMTLSIFFTKNGLEDMNQSVLYTYNKENSLEKPWYSVM